MNTLPDDLIKFITSKLSNYNDLKSFKSTCKVNSILITSYSIASSILKKKFIEYKPYKMCINCECYDETWDLYEDVYYEGYHRYTHYHQLALNTCEIKINKKFYKISTPYCCECFKKYVLIGDNENVKDNLIINKVDLEYSMQIQLNNNYYL